MIAESKPDAKSQLGILLDIYPVAFGDPQTCAGFNFVRLFVGIWTITESEDFACKRSTFGTRAREPRLDRLDQIVSHTGWVTRPLPCLPPVNYGRFDWKVRARRAALITVVHRLCESAWRPTM